MATTITLPVQRAMEVPFDDGTSGPLVMWETNTDADGALQKIPAWRDMREVVQPGTAVDCVRLFAAVGRSNRLWDATHNPYITVDWIPIDDGV